MIQVICCKHVHDMGHEFCLIVDGVQDESLKLFREMILNNHSNEDPPLQNCLALLHFQKVYEQTCAFSERPEFSKYTLFPGSSWLFFLYIPSTCCC